MTDETKGEALFLEVLGAAGVVRTAELPRQGKLIVGSSDERASVVVEGQGVADVHCAIGRLKSGGWALKDLGSDFGTLVNGKRVESARLANGDEILIGSQRLRIANAAGLTTAARAPEPTPPAAPEGERRPRPKRKVPSTKPAPAKVDVGGYVVERQLGRGAMGNVVLATQTSLDRKVALKLLKGTLAKDQEFVDRFRTEARAAARLNHPNIVTVFDVGEENGHHYLSMEFMDGGSVEAQLEASGPIPWREALGILRDAAAGLVYAESRGIVHRDIKPENLMRSSEGVTKIADLGLAVQVEQEAVDSGSGKVLGTPHFIAPEVVRGASADARSDLYSLGATAYRILSGRTPHEGAHARDILRSLLSEEPPRLGALVPGLPGGVEAFVHQLLAKDPDKRQPAAAIVVREIDALRASGGGAQAEASSAGSGGSRLLALAGAAALVLGGAVFFLTRGGGDAEVDEPSAGSPSTVGDSGSGGQGTRVGDPTVADSSTGNAGAGIGTDPNRTASEGPSDPNMAATGTAGPGEQLPPPGTTAAEADFEFRAQAALFELDDQELTHEQKIAALRELAAAFAGTDAGMEASSRADALAGAANEAAEAARLLDAARSETMSALGAAGGLGVEGSEGAPGRGENLSVAAALSALAAVPIPEDLKGDQVVAGERKRVVDAILERAMERGRSATAAADKAEASGDFPGTVKALREFVEASKLSPEASALLNETEAGMKLAYEGYMRVVEERLASLAGRETEFARERLAKERADVGRALGENFEADLRLLDLGRAAGRLREAARIVSRAELSARMESSAADLQAGAAAIEALITGWKTPGWHRRTVLRPSGDERAEAVGVTADAILLEVAGGEPERLQISAWSVAPKALQNLFLSRLDRPWTLAESRGIVTILAASATLHALDDLSPALVENSRRLTPEATQSALAAYGEALEWAEDVDDDRSDDGPRLRAIAEREQAAVKMLVEALVAREDGEWSHSAAILSRLIQERRDTLLVMMLSDGGRR